MNRKERLREQGFYQVFVIEFGPHVQVILPWLICSDSITNSSKKVFVPSQAVQPLRSHMKTNQLIADVLTIESIVSEIKKFKSKNSKASLKIIVTSAPESRISIKTVLAILYLARTSCDVICIRSPREWFHSTRRKAPVPRLSTRLLTHLKVYCLDLVSFFAQRLLFIRSSKVVFEHQNMMDFFLCRSKWLASRKPKLVFSGRFKKNNLELDGIPIQSSKDAKFLGIGILGTLNPDRRDYGQLKQALESLQKQGFGPRVFFLGGHVGKDSETVIEMFHKFLGFAPTAEIPYVSDSQVLLMQPELQILIAPLSKDWGYSQGKSSGSVSDAVYLTKPLILPNFAKHIFDYDWISYYSSAEELHDLISRFDSLPLPVMEVSESELTSFLRK